jgi:tetratricopeptide (TPR) repeat protein
MLLKKILNINKEKKMMIAVFALFLLLVLFYKWQVMISSGYLFLGNENYKNEDYNESLQNYKYAAAVDGDKDVAYSAKLKRAEIFYTYNRLDEAEKEAREAMREIENNFRAYEILGDIYYAKLNLTSAIKHYQKSIELKKDNSEAIEIKLAKSFMAKGEISIARDIFSELYSKNKSNDEIPYYLGIIGFYENGLYNDYLKSVEKSEDNSHKEKTEDIKKFLDDGYDEIGNEMYLDVLTADLFNKINEPHLAIAKSRKTMEKKINYRDAFLVLGKSYFLIKDYKNSYENFSRALELDSHNPEIKFWLGIVSQKIENDQKAKEFIDRSGKSGA